MAEVVAGTLQSQIENPRLYSVLVCIDGAESPGRVGRRQVRMRVRQISGDACVRPD